MNVYKWILDVYDGSCWIQTYRMPNPGNKGVTVGGTSNARVIQLWDGSRAFLSPQVQSLKEPFDFEITEASSTQAIYLQLKDYADNQRKVRITTHTSEQVTGYIVSVKKTYTLSGKDQKYTITVNFVPEN